MPVELAPVSRRSLLAGAAAMVVAGPVLAPRAWAQRPATPNPHRFALLSDTHVPAKPTTKNLFVNMTERVRHVVNEIATLADMPAAAVVNGDCAYLRGEEEDYAAFGAAIGPLRRRGMNVHLVMGNHDDRRACAAVLQGLRPNSAQAAARRVGVVETERANFFLLDSLRKTNGTSGELGGDQVRWLAAALDARRDKPAIVFGHHHPDFNADSDLRTDGLIDTARLFVELDRRPHVVAYVFGHTHRWHYQQHRGIHLVNLPAASYVLKPGQPAGWVDMLLKPQGMVLTLRCLNSSHPDHGRTLNLTWRAA